MPGYVGVSDGRTVSRSLERLDYEDWYETDVVETDDAGLGLVHHGSKDSNGHSVWRDRRGAGVLYGTISNRNRLGVTTDDVLEGLLDRPLSILPDLDGPFAVACYDARDGSFLAATDKLGTRDCFYAPTSEGVATSSELKAVLARRETVDLDRRAAADLLQFGHVLGDKTLADGVSALPPASLLEYADGDLTVRRYWEPEFERTPDDEYVEETLAAYRRAVADVAETIDGTAGLYLSGGLDSRLLAGVLREEYGPFRTLTYDGNPTDGSNPPVARRVADRLGVDNRVIDRSPEGFESFVRRGVEITDGMVSWEFFTNPHFVFEGLHESADVLLEGAPQGELFGDQILLSDLQDDTSVTELIVRRMGGVDVETVSSLFDAPVDPVDSVRTAVDAVDRRRFEDRVMDVWLRNFCSNSHFRSTKLERSQTGTRIPFASGALLDAVAGMPHGEYRRDAVPFSREIPRSMSPLKRRLACHFGGGLESIPYERTGLAPTRPLWLHDVTYLARQSWWRFVGGRPTPVADWSRDHVPMTEALDEWLDRACRRSLFDETAIRRLRREHFRGNANHIRTIARITTLEQWLETYVDADAERTSPERTTMD